MKQTYFSWSQDSDIRYIQTLLTENKLVIGTSDTVIGLFTAVSLQGYTLLNEVKQRQGMPYIILIENQYYLKSLTDRKYYERYQEMLTYCWPGPVTTVFPAKKSLPHFMTGGGHTVAVRVPQHEGLLSLLKNMSCVFSTSANRHGMPIPDEIKVVDPFISTHAAAIIINHQHTAQPSTIIDCTSLETIKIIREGAYPTGKIKQIS